LTSKRFLSPASVVAPALPMAVFAFGAGASVIFTSAIAVGGCGATGAVVEMLTQAKGVAWKPAMSQILKLRYEAAAVVVASG
jgi:hypothetical protein